MHKIENFQTTCEDGVVLKGLLLIPENPKSVIQFNCGTATKKEFYLKFLTYFAENNHICCLWDYRGNGEGGNGESSPLSLKNCDYRFADYGQKDMPAIKAYLNQRFPQLPFLFITHSAGGQQIGFIPNLENVSGSINLGVSTGYLPGMPLHYRLQGYFFFYLFSPISVMICGYIAAKRFGIMEDLPKNVINEWKDWCTKEDYLFDSKFLGKTIPKDTYQNIDFPIKVYYASDEEICTEMNTNNFWKNVKTSKSITKEKLAPENFGLKRIGHFGYFKTNLKDSLWNTILSDINQFIE
jgi:predicted alpha/beta hydrolase